MEINSNLMWKTQPLHKLDATITNAIVALRATQHKLRTVTGGSDSNPNLNTNICRADGCELAADFRAFLYHMLGARIGDYADCAEQAAEARRLFRELFPDDNLGKYNA